MSTFTNPLDNIRIASPCPANWDEMFGDDRKRHCGQCSKSVYNLSKMTRQEAESLLINSEGRLCVRYFRRADGTVLTADCPVGWRAIKKRMSRVATASVSMFAGLFAGSFAFGFGQWGAMPNRSDVEVSSEVSDLPFAEAVVGEVGDTSVQPGYWANGQPEIGSRSSDAPTFKLRLERKPVK